MCTKVVKNYENYLHNTKKLYYFCKIFYEFYNKNYRGKQ